MRRARVGVLGLTFKENVPDLRNSRVPDILRELASFGIEAAVHDPLADPAPPPAEYGVELGPLELLRDLDALGAGGAAPRPICELGEAGLAAMLAPAGILIDVKSALDPAGCPPASAYWSL